MLLAVHISDSVFSTSFGGFAMYMDPACYVIIMQSSCMAIGKVEQSSCHPVLRSVG